MEPRYATTRTSIVPLLLKTAYESRNSYRIPICNASVCRPAFPLNTQLKLVKPNSVLSK